MELWKERNIKVIPVVASVALAKRMERCGADAVVAEGCESGGHIGESTTMTLVPQVVDAVDIPVTPPEGSVMAEELQQRLCWGQRAYRWVHGLWSQMNVRYIRLIRNASSGQRILIQESHRKKYGTPDPALRNDMTKAYLQKEQEGASTEELELLASGALRRAVQEGDIHNGSLMSGQIAGLIKEEVSCKQLIDTLVSQTKEALNRSRMYE